MSLERKNSSLLIFMEHRPELINYAKKFIDCPHRAEDIVQEAFVKFNKASSTTLLCSPTAYLFRIVRNLAIDSLRVKSRESKVISSEPEFENIADDTPTPENVALYKSEMELMNEALNELPERTRTALEMHRINGYKLKEIAAKLNISTNLAHSLICEGMKHCRMKMYG